VRRNFSQLTFLLPEAKRTFGGFLCCKAQHEQELTVLRHFFADIEALEAVDS
jgi:hypothetical protein